MVDRISTPEVPRVGTRWLRALRVVIILQTINVFAAAITAGLQLTDPSLHALHSATSYTLFTLVVLHLAIAALAWRPGGGSPQPLLYAALFLAGTLAQIALGLTGLSFAHVPLGMLLFGASTLQLVWIWTTPTPLRPVTNDRVGSADPKVSRSSANSTSSP